MSYKFIEIEYVQQRLIGRLNFDHNGCPIGSKVVDSILLDRVIRQKEAMLEGYLNMIYVTPLQLKEDITKLILSEIVENLVVATILPIHYQGGSMPQTGVEPSSLAGASAESAQNMIQIYITGHNMYIPGTNSSPTSPRGGPIPQPVVLPGEVIRSPDNYLDTNKRHETYIGSSSVSKVASNDLFDFDCL